MLTTLTTKVINLLPGVGGVCVLGYPYGKKGWKLYDLERKVVFVSRDVLFHESEFPFATSGSGHSTKEIVIYSSPQPISESDSEEETDQNTLEQEASHEISHDDNHTSDDATATSAEQNSNEIIGRGRRHKIPSTRLKDYVVDTVTSSQTYSLSSSILAPQPSSGTAYPLCNFVSCDRFSQKHLDFLVTLSATMEQRSFAEAMKDERWGKAVECELTSLEEADIHGRLNIYHLVRRHLVVNGSLQLSIDQMEQ